MWIFQSTGSSSSQQLCRTGDFLHPRCAWGPPVAGQRVLPWGVISLPWWGRGSWLAGMQRATPLWSHSESPGGKSEHSTPEGFNKLIVGQTLMSQQTQICRVNCREFAISWVVLPRCAPVRLQQLGILLQPYPSASHPFIFQVCWGSFSAASSTQASLRHCGRINFVQSKAEGHRQRVEQLQMCVCTGKKENKSLIFVYSRL